MTKKDKRFKPKFMGLELKHVKMKPQKHANVSKGNLKRM